MSRERKRRRDKEDEEDEEEYAFEEEDECKRVLPQFLMCAVDDIEETELDDDDDSQEELLSRPKPRKPKKQSLPASTVNQCMVVRRA